jgi:hypothetical protein
MKPIITCLIMLVLASHTNAQTPFEKTYTKILNPGWFVYQDIGYIEELTSGGYTGVGAYNPTAGGYTTDWSITVWQINAFGDTIWVKQLYSADANTYWLPVDADVLPDASILILYKKYTSDYNFNGVIKVSTSGTILWNCPITDQSQYASGNLKRLRATADGGCVVAGATSFFPTLPLLSKVSASGNVSWNNYYFSNDQGYNKLNDVCISTDGSYLVTGIVHNNSTNKDRMLVAKSSSAGVTAWNLVLNSGDFADGDSIKSEGFAIAPAPNGGCVVSGYQTQPGNWGRDAWVLGVNSAGDWPPLWEQHYYYNQSANAIGLWLQTLNNGNYLLFASTNYGNTSDVPRLAKLDATGNILWDQIGYYNYWAYSVSPRSVTATNEVLFSGRSSNDPNYAKFMHTTTNGLFKAPKPKFPYNQAINEPPYNQLVLDEGMNIHIFSSYWFQLSVDSTFATLHTNIQYYNNDTLPIQGLGPLTTYFWRVKGVGADNSTTPWSELYRFTTDNSSVGIVELANNPLAVRCYPNPMDDYTQIEFTLKQPAELTLYLLNAYGEVVYQHHEGTTGAGNHTLTVHNKGFAAGVYVVEIYSNGAAIGFAKLLVL